MKILSSGALAFAALSSMVGARDVKFNATADHEHAGHNMTKGIRTAANLMGDGAKMQLCPSGDCTNGQAITLALSRLVEVQVDKQGPVQQATNFNALNATWSDLELIQIGGVDAKVSSFVTTFKVGNATTDTSFNLTAVIYQANGTAQNGNQTIDVPAGALKFSVLIKNWPFKSPANKLHIGVELKAQGKNKMDREPGQKKPKQGKKNMDRVDMGEGMFMDSPTLAVIDGVDTPINSSVEAQNKKAELVWEFPSFNESLYYDPVAGSEDATTSATSAPTSSTPAPTSGASAMRSVIAAASVVSMAAALAL